MIENIEIENFKSLRRARLELGALNLVVGAHSSGKSNLLDALGVLQGVAYGCYINEIFNGMPATASTEAWPGIAGGTALATYSDEKHKDETGERFISLAVKLKTTSLERYTYRIAFSAQPAAVHGESLVGSRGIIYDRKWSCEALYYPKPCEGPLAAALFLRLETDYPKYPEGPLVYGRPNPQGKRGPNYEGMPLLRWLPWWCEDVTHVHQELLKVLTAQLANMQRLEAVPAILREYAAPQPVKRIGQHGEDFAAMVNTIISDPRARTRYLSWLQKLASTPPDDVVLQQSARGKLRFALKEGNEIRRASELSDGTLRVGAIAAAALQPDMPELLMIEDIENDVDPNRLSMLVELLKTQALQTGRQIIATTRSPAVLTGLSDQDYETTFLCKRDPTTGESIIKPLPAVPDFIETLKRQPVEDLFAEGWLERAL